MTRQEILEEAIRTVVTDRQNDYGDAEDNFKAIADYWTLYLKKCGVHFTELGAVDVAIMMMFVKIARIQSGHHKDDNWVDIAGYASCGGELSGNVG